MYLIGHHLYIITRKRHGLGSSKDSDFRIFKQVDSWSSHPKGVVIKKGNEWIFYNQSKKRIKEFSGGKDYAALGLAGDYLTFVWRLRPKIEVYINF